jgi:hypothetical protein
VVLGVVLILAVSACGGSGKPKSAATMATVSDAAVKSAFVSLGRQCRSIGARTAACRRAGAALPAEIGLRAIPERPGDQPPMGGAKSADVYGTVYNLCAGGLAGPWVGLLSSAACAGLATLAASIGSLAYDACVSLGGLLGNVEGPFLGSVCGYIKTLPH